MGGQKSKQAGGKPIKVPNKMHGLSHKDLNFLAHQTGLSEYDVKSIYDQFMASNPDGQLNRFEFVRLYNRLRTEPPERLDEISQHVFRAFDGDHNGYITFGEFLVSFNQIYKNKFLTILNQFIKSAYALTSRGDVRHKLEYVFDMYDLDNNGYLDRRELATVVHGMLDLLVSVFNLL